MERTGEGGKGKLKEALKVALKGQHSDANGTDLESTAHTTACVWLQLCLSPSPLASNDFHQFYAFGDRGDQVI